MKEFVFAGQADLDRIRHDQDGVCWWCGGIADSREHRHKASILRSMWGSDGLYLGREGQAPYSIPSWRSRAVKFGKVLCQTCNNVRSQPFDRAYDIYAQFIQSNATRLTRATSIDWREVYGVDWETPTRLLGCYAVKQFGCWIAEGGFKPSTVFAAFLGGGELVDTRLMLARQHSASLAQRAIHLDGGPDLDRGIGVLGAVGWLSPERDRLVGYEQYSYISDICMRFNWADNSGNGDLFWSRPIASVETLPATARQRALVARIGARALGRRVWRLVKRPRQVGRTD